jgi:hypothetical protein
MAQKQIISVQEEVLQEKSSSQDSVSNFKHKQGGQAIASLVSDNSMQDAEPNTNKL